MQDSHSRQTAIRLGTHGENYGNWMSNPVFYMIGGLLALAVALAVLSFTVFRLTVLGVIFLIAAAIFLALLVWIAWIRRQYAFGGGGMMERVHHTILSHLDYDGKGTLLDVGCGSGALAIRAALTWRSVKVTGIDYWGAAYGYGQAMCEKNAASEGVGSRCAFQHGDANGLDFPDESFDAVVSNYVYHNSTGADKHEPVSYTHLATWPLFNTRIWSAFTMEWSRWAMTMTVFPLMISAIAAFIFSSFSGSMKAVALSLIHI